MQLWEAKVFVKAVVAHRQVGAVPELESIPHCQPTLQPEPEPVTTTIPRDKDAPALLAAVRVSGLHPQSDTPRHLSIKAPVNSSADPGANVNAYTDETRAVVRGDTVARRGVLSSGFRLVSMSDEELRRNRNVAGESSCVPTEYVSRQNALLCCTSGRYDHN